MAISADHQTEFNQKQGNTDQEAEDPTPNRNDHQKGHDADRRIPDHGSFHARRARMMGAAGSNPDSHDFFEKWRIELGS